MEIFVTLYVIIDKLLSFMKQPRDHTVLIVGIRESQTAADVEWSLVITFKNITLLC